LGTSVLDDPLIVGSGSGGPPRGGTGGRGGDGERDGRTGLLADPSRLGLWLFLGTLTMMFIGFTSAYMVRRASGGWLPLDPPGLLWVNSAVLLASSATLEIARRRLRGWDLPGAQTWTAFTGLLGAGFVAGQLYVWGLLVERGYYLASSPHNSFFFLLTGIHALHLFGGLLWFAAVLGRFRRLAYVPGEDGLRLFATYWHFLGGLWLYLVFLLFVM
jgi:cytochrome c oxidase subunit III